MKGRLPLAAIVSMAAVSACSVLTPDYRRPPAATINRPDVQAHFDAAVGTPVSNGPAAQRWWELYDDARLNRLVQAALAGNTDLRVAAANLARVEATYDVTRDARFPQLALQATGDYSRDSAEEQLTAGPLPNERVYGLGASVSYQVDLFGQIRRSIEAAGADVAAARAASATTRITVVAQTVDAYLAACSAGREIDVANRAIGIQVEGTTLAQRQFGRGRTNSLDVTRSTTQEDQLRATLPPLEAQRQQSLYRLAVLTGLPPGDFPKDLATCKQEPTLREAIPVGDGRALLARRPDVARAEDQLHAATANVGVVTAGLYPKITLGASGGSVGLMKNFLSDDTYKFSIGPLISWQFPNRGRAKAEIRGANAEVDASYARFDGTVLNALREVESALTAYGHDLERLRRLLDAKQSAQRASDDARTLYGAGRDSFLSVLDADRNLLAIEQTAAAQQSRIASDQVQLFLALGGGWESP